MLRTYLPTNCFAKLERIHYHESNLLKYLVDCFKQMLLPIGISTMEDFIIPIIGATSSLVIFIDN